MTNKAIIKRLLLACRLWYPLVFIRQSPAMLRWIVTGCTSSAPPALKMLIVKSYLRRFQLQRFVETGTHFGETLGYIALTGVPCTSIELSRSAYDAARSRFANYPNVTLLYGDSGIRIGECLDATIPTLFWLDGHYSGGATARDEVDTPIKEELRSILQHHVRGHVILIDDASSFKGMNGYPHLDDLLEFIRSDGRYESEISTDIVRLTPTGLDHVA